MDGPSCFEVEQRLFTSKLECMMTEGLTVNGALLWKCARGRCSRASSSTISGYVPSYGHKLQPQRHVLLYFQLSSDECEMSQYICPSHKASSRSIWGHNNYIMWGGNWCTRNVMWSLSSLKYEVVVERRCSHFLDSCLCDVEAVRQSGLRV